MLEKKYETIRDIMNHLNGRFSCYESEVSAQSVCGRLEANLSSEFSEFIKEAAKCHHYASDVIYDIGSVNSMMEHFNPGDYPNTKVNDGNLPVIALGFRKMGVDGNSFILSRLDGNCYNIDKEYFAVYFVEVRRDGDYQDWWKIHTVGYHV